MGGFFNLFKNMGRVSDAKAQKAADAIESENSVEFGKQDISKMKNELAKCNSNIGTLKGEIAVLEEKIKGIKSDIIKHDEDAKALDLAGKTDLAAKHCEISDTLEGQVASLDLALITQKDLLKEQIKSKEELKTTITLSENKLVTLKAMRDAAIANENLAKISTSSGTNALTDFNRREEEAKKRLIRSQSIKEESSDKDDLKTETEKALGRSGSLSRLERLRAK